MKRRKMQKLIAGVMCGLMIASLTGCSGSSGAGNSDAEVKSTAPVVSEQAGNGAADGEVKEITLWDIQTEESMRGIFADSIARFEADHPGYKINEICYGSEDYKQKIAIALGSDTAPDIFVTWTGGGMKEYIDAGRITDLTEYMDQDNYKDYFMDAAIQQTVVDDKIWAVPVENCSIAAIFYNKALFSKYNLEVPKHLKNWRRFVIPSLKMVSHLLLFRIKRNTSHLWFTCI